MKPLNPITPYHPTLTFRLKRSLRDWSYVIAFAVIAVVILGCIVAQVRIYADCRSHHGTTVKNAFDWPTCIEEGKH